MVAMRVLCEVRATLSHFLEDIIHNGGEGTILRRPASLYENGRSNSLVKIKAARADTEALVREVSEDHITVQLPSGITFEVDKDGIKSDLVLGTRGVLNSELTPETYLNPQLDAIRVGNVVTVAYDHYSKFGVPIGAQITRVRFDLPWTTVLRDYALDTPKKNFLNDASHRIAIEITSKPNSYWTKGSGKNLRAYLKQFARSKQLDPLLPSTWYSFNAETFAAIKGMKPAIDHFGGYIRALMYLFPDIGLKVEDFAQFPKRYWRIPENRKLFLEEFAAENNFDPLVAENWYKVTLEQLKGRKGGASMLRYYNFKLSRALPHIFPQIAFDKSKFTINLFGRFRDAHVRREYFDEIARQMGFDPLIPANWYLVNQEDIRAEENYNSVVQYHRGNFAKALMDLYPEIGLHEDRFSIQEIHAKRKVFDAFAATNSFDPLVAENWRNTPGYKLKEDENTKPIVDYYGSIIKSLRILYPDVGFNTTTRPFHYWSDESNRRQFFNNMAKLYGFDPLIPENWYNLKTSTVSAQMEGHTVLSYYNFSLRRALLHLYPDIGLDAQKIGRYVQRDYWSEATNRKSFFSDFAAKSGFDPLHPDNWYSVTVAQLQEHKRADSVLAYYGRSLRYAVMDLYPDIGLNINKFANISKTRKARDVTT